MSKAIATDVLIELVRRNECLWDRSNANYRDKQEKDAAWLEIYRALEPEFDNLSEDVRNLIGAHITRKWHNARDSYAKFLRGHSIRNKPYRYAKQLSFLEPIYFHYRKDGTNSEEKSDAEERWFDEVFIVDGNENSEPEAKRLKTNYHEKYKDPVTAHAEHSNDSVLNLLTTFLNKQSDDDNAFFVSIMPSVKKLPDDTKFEFRIKVMNVLQDMLKREKVAKLKQEKSQCSDSD